MTTPKLVILTHGIGKYAPGFSKPWVDILNKNHDSSLFQVKELLWDDVLTKIETQYPIISNEFAQVLSAFKLDAAKTLLNNDTYQMVNAYAMDVLVYTLKDMCQYILGQCQMKLAALCGADKSRAILIGHSLGAAMLPHLVWDEYKNTGAIPYLGLILLASPLGIESPIPSIMDDLLGILGKIRGGDRLTTLKYFAGAWSGVGDQRLHFLINQNDLICWDAKFKLPNGSVQDIIPVRKGFNPAELDMLERAHPNCTHRFIDGSNELSAIAGNHATELYLNRPEFKTAFDNLIRL